MHACHAAKRQIDRQNLEQIRNPRRTHRRCDPPRRDEEQNPQPTRNQRHELQHRHCEFVSIRPPGHQAHQRPSRRQPDRHADPVHQQNRQRIPAIVRQPEIAREIPHQHQPASQHRHSRSDHPHTPSRHPRSGRRFGNAGRIQSGCLLATRHYGTKKSKGTPIHLHALGQIHCYSKRYCSKGTTSMFLCKE